MSIEKVTYKKGNKEETKYRVRIKRKNLSHDEYFDTLKEAEIKNTEILLKLKQGIIPTLTAKEEATIPTLEMLCDRYFEEVNKKIGKDHLGYEFTVKTNENRLKNVIPNVLLHSIGARKSTKKEIKFINPEKNSFDSSIRFGDILITSFSADKFLIKEYIEARRGISSRTGKPLADSTIKKELTLLSQAFTYANELFEDVMDESIFNPVLMLSKNEKPRKAKPKKSKLQEGDKETILEYFKLRRNQEAYFVHKIGFETGLRKTEILMGFKKENHTFKNGYSIMTIPFTKNTKEIMVQLDEEITEYLKSKKYNDDEDRYFFMTAWNLQRYIEDCRKQTGIQNWSFHDLRRENITNLILGSDDSAIKAAAKANLSVASIQPILQEKKMMEIFAKLQEGQRLSDEEIMLLHNHSTASMTERYFSDKQAK